MRRRSRVFFALPPCPPCQDIVTRYASGTGHHVTRRFGWDCHGLPVEYEIDKKLSESSTKSLQPLFVRAVPPWQPLFLLHCPCHACFLLARVQRGSLRRRAQAPVAHPTLAALHWSVFGGTSLVEALHAALHAVPACIPWVPYQFPAGGS